jgi:hypothetical protein
MAFLLDRVLYLVGEANSLDKLLSSTKMKHLQHKQHTNHEEGHHTAQKD